MKNLRSKCYLVLLFVNLICFFTNSLVLGGQGDLTPNDQLPKVVGKKLKLVQNTDVVVSIAQAMASKGIIDRTVLEGNSLSDLITVYSFKLSKKGNDPTYFVRAAIGPGGLCGAKSCPSWVYVKTSAGYAQIFESDLGDTITFEDSGAYPKIKRQGGNNTRWTHILKFNGTKYVQ